MTTLNIAARLLLWPVLVYAYRLGRYYWRHRQDQGIPLHTERRQMWTRDGTLLILLATLGGVGCGSPTAPTPVLSTCQTYPVAFTNPDGTVGHDAYVYEQDGPCPTIPLTYGLIP